MTDRFAAHFELPPEDDSPQVAMPSRPWVAPLGFIGALALGGLVFWQLSENRTRMDDARLTDPAPGSQPIMGLEGVPAPMDISALLQPETAEAANMPNILEPTVPPPPAASPAPDLEARLRSPSLIVDLSEPGAPPAAGVASGGPGVSPGAIAQAVGGRGAASGGTRSADERFAEELGVGAREGAARARRMGDQTFTVVQGSMIPGVLETALNSDLPGYVRAVVTRDVRGFDGREVLVPRGSRLIGQYRAGVAMGQSRAFVIWTRIIRPDGVAVDLASPGTDALGRGGLEGRVDRHFLQRFGGAIVLSLISAGASAATSDSDTQVIIASTQGASDIATSALNRDLDIAPTVRVPQGAPIRIFVTQDLDFSVIGDAVE
ncbi:MAG: type IV secretion system protein VirB10 [Hyphomonadaceae bacterium]|nr:type IV secretion system protein VirB10 [Hyphomonadaceae bacterium]